MSISSPGDEDAVDSAFQAYMDRARSAFRDTTLTAQGRALAHAAVAPGKVGAPGVQVSTFAVDGAQANDIVMIKRVPVTTEGPNFLLYIPEDDGASFHTFTTREEMTVWLKALANDPEAGHICAAFLPSVGAHRGPGQANNDSVCRRGYQCSGWQFCL
jgi:hypothetical protein